MSDVPTLTASLALYEFATLRRDRASRCATSAALTPTTATSSCATRWAHSTCSTPRGEHQTA